MEDLRQILDLVVTGSLSPDDAVMQLRQSSYADLGYAKIDHGRAARIGFPEAVYAPGKTVEHCVGAVGELLDNGVGPVIVTRVSAEQRVALLEAIEGSEQFGTTLVWCRAPERIERIALVAAGTGDIAVATECQATLHGLGFAPVTINDVGVAGLHRLIDSLDEIRKAQVVVVFAGMEGALASVLGGLIAAPIIAVPTSTGYGSSLEGVTALLAMHASCAAGITVVGIDNGFGAACAVARILNSN